MAVLPDRADDPPNHGPKHQVGVVASIQTSRDQCVSQEMMYGGYFQWLSMRTRGQQPGKLQQQ